MYSQTEVRSYSKIKTILPSFVARQNLCACRLYTVSTITTTNTSYFIWCADKCFPLVPQVLTHMTHSAATPYTSRDCTALHISSALPKNVHEDFMPSYAWLSQHLFHQQPTDGTGQGALGATLTLLHFLGAAHQGMGGKRAWTKNKLEELRRRSPGRDRDSAAHHAKPGPNANMGNQKEKRRLVTFIGGIDMCDGRYDTPRHSLFHTLATVHTEDFHQACITGADIKKGGEQAQLLSAVVGAASEDRKLCSAAELFAFGHG